MNTTETGSLWGYACDSNNASDELAAAYGAWIATTQELEKLRPEWNELFNAMGPSRSLLSFDSICDRWNSAEPGSKLAIIAVRSASGRLVALAPLYITCSKEEGSHAKRLSFLIENHNAADRSKILIDPGFEDAVVQEIARMLVDHRCEWDYVDLALPGLMPLLDYVNSMAPKPLPPIARRP